MKYRMKFRVYVSGEFNTETNSIRAARAIIQAAGNGRIWDNYQGCIVESYTTSEPRS